LGVPSYLIETFLARGDAGALAKREQLAAAEKLSQTGVHVRFEGAIHVPRDEICFFIFEAPSGRDAAVAAHHAELDALRVVEAVSSANEQEEK
jgi:beta-glucosidase-like glycosyl hydrolase